MREMADIPGTLDACPFKFNFDPARFMAGDFVSYRVPERFGDMPFVGTLLEVFDDHVLIVSPNEPGHPMRGTRASRPIVSAQEALG